MSGEAARIPLQRGFSRRSSVVIKAKTSNLDEVLKEIGGCSHYQIRRHVLFFLISIPFACQSLFMVFAGQKPDICIEIGLSECRKIDTTHKEDYCPFSSRQYLFMQPEKFSVITEFELVCDKSFLEQIAHSMYFPGGFLGTIVIGWIAHRFGRKSVMFCCLAIVSLTATLSAFADSFWFLIMARFLTGFFLSGVAVSLYVIASEITGATYRFHLDLFIWNYFSVGLMVLALKAYLLQNWRNLQLATTLPYLSVCVFFKFFPESLRWLWSTGHYTKANKTVSKIAAENKRSDALDMFPDVLSIESDDNELGCFVLFRSTRLMTHFFAMAFSSLAVGFSYFGLFLVSEYLSGNLYADFALMAAVEIPANFLAIFVTRRFGRKKTVMLSFLVTCVISGSLFAINKDRDREWRHASLGLALCCKFSLTVASLSSMIWTSEVHKAEGRYQHVGVVNSLRLLGGTAAPWLTTYVLESDPGVVFAVMSGLSAVAALLSVLLPETKKTRDDSMEDSEADYKCLNGTTDQNLNQTMLTSTSESEKPSISTDINFDYANLSQMDRETDI